MLLAELVLCQLLIINEFIFLDFLSTSLIGWFTLLGGAVV